MVKKSTIIQRTKEKLDYLIYQMSRFAQFSNVLNSPVLQFHVVNL